MLKKGVKEVKKLMFLGVLLMSFGFAQIWDSGVDESTDEFTSERSCNQRVDISLSSNTGVMMALIDGEVVTYLQRQITDYNNVFNIYGSTNPTVYLRFPDDTVQQLTPDVARADEDFESEYAAILDNDLAYKLMALPGDLRVSFQDDGTQDFSIDHEVFVTLAQGFGRACVD